MQSKIVLRVKKYLMMRKLALQSATVRIAVTASRTMLTWSVKKVLLRQIRRSPIWQEKSRPLKFLILQTIKRIQAGRMPQLVRIRLTKVVLIVLMILRCSIRRNNRSWIGSKFSYKKEWWASHRVFLKVSFMSWSTRPSIRRLSLLVCQQLVNGPITSSTLCSCH